MIDTNIYIYHIYIYRRIYRYYIVDVGFFEDLSSYKIWPVASNHKDLEHFEAALVVADHSINRNGQLCPNCFFLGVINHFSKLSFPVLLNFDDAWCFIFNSYC